MLAMSGGKAFLLLVLVCALALCLLQAYNQRRPKSRFDQKGWKRSKSEEKQVRALKARAAAGDTAALEELELFKPDTRYDSTCNMKNRPCPAADCCPRSKAYAGLKRK